MKYLCFFSLLILIAHSSISCDKIEQQTISFDYDYYPLSSGHYITYQIDSFHYSDAAYPLIKIDTVSYQFKEFIDTVYKDNENRDAYRIITYKRADATAAWSLYRVWSVVRNTSNIVKNEDDLHYIKLIFPVTNAASWAGNSLIVTDQENEYLKDWKYTYKNVAATQSYGSVNYDSCVTVMLIDDENVIEKKYSVEQYAKNIGLIYKEQKFLGKQRNLSSGWDFPESGYWTRQVIIDHN